MLSDQLVQKGKNVTSATLGEQLKLCSGGAAQVSSGRAAIVSCLEAQVSITVGSSFSLLPFASGFSKGNFASKRFHITVTNLRIFIGANGGAAGTFPASYPLHEGIPHLYVGSTSNHIDSIAIAEVKFAPPEAKTTIELQLTQCSRCLSTRRRGIVHYRTRVRQSGGSLTSGATPTPTT